MCDFRVFAPCQEGSPQRFQLCSNLKQRYKSLRRVNTSTLFHSQSQIKEKRYEKKKEEGKFQHFPSTVIQNAFKCSGELAIASEKWKGFNKVTLSNCETLIREQINDAIKVKKKFFSVSEILRRNVSVT